jgi:hypothetical protein
MTIQWWGLVSAVVILAVYHFKISLSAYRLYLDIDLQKYDNSLPKYSTVTNVTVTKDQVLSDKGELAPGILPLSPWERESAESRNCTLPVNVPQYCCLGSISKGGRMKYFPDICNDSTIYSRVQDHTLEYLDKTWRELNQGSIQIKDDVMQIVDYLLKFKLQLSFVGDSLTRQVSSGLECELFRRGYQVQKRKLNKLRKPAGCSWRHCIGEKVRFVVQDPKNTSNIFSYTHWGVYRPQRDKQNSEMKKHVISSSDIVVFDHGLHWKPFEKQLFLEDMKDYLVAYKDTNLTLVAWRETSAQHFDSPGGHYGVGKKSTECVPIIEGQQGHHEPLMRQATSAAGLMWKSVLDANFSYQKWQPNELVFFPYRDYTVPLYYLHPDECTHFCHTPFVWLPIWRSLRVAMDRSLQGKAL